MSGGKERRRSISTAQLKLRQMCFKFDGSEGASPTPAGFDQFVVSSITRLQTGQYTCIFAKPFERAPEAFAHVYADENRYCVIEAVAYDRVTFSIRRRDTQARVNDAARVWVLGSDARYDVA